MPRYRIHPLHAESKNPADYPLRIHIFSPSETNFYQFPPDLRVDFNFDCSQKLKASFGYETYPAKWKKQNQS